MDFVNCYQCGSQFSGRNVYRVDNKLKKNACAFKETFDNLNIDNPKFCRSCQKAWLRLENIRGKAAINNFISERIKEMESKNKVNETSGGNDLNNSDQNTISDDFLAVPGPSGNQKKHLKRTSVQNVTIDEPLNKTLAHNDAVGEKTKTEFEDNIVDQVNDLTQSGPSEIKNDSLSETSDNRKKDEENAVKDYDYWKCLVQKTWSSDDVGAKFRYEFKYYMNKMKEAEKNGFAEDDVRDYDYWCNLFNQIFKSDASGKECTEDLRYFLGKMKETYQIKT